MTENHCTRQKIAAAISTWLIDPLSAEVRRATERLARAQDVCGIAVMPDVHLAGSVCIGTVVATRRLVYPQAIGADIGCGMAAIAFHAEADAVGAEPVARSILGELRDAVPVMRHRGLAVSPSLPEALAERPLSHPALRARTEHEGRVEFGTLGRGNHFLEFQADDEGRLWLMVHSGSRAMGQYVTDWHARNATKSGGGLSYLDAEEPTGHDYLSDVAWARRYADLSRQRMIQASAKLLSGPFGIAADWDSLITCDHNHVQREEHGGQLLWVHRKGANEAAEGRAGIIPGSMGTWSVHVIGRGCPEAFRSSSHGAGRRLGRHEARRQISGRRLSAELEGVWFDERSADGLREEAPSAYKDIEAVLRAQRELVRIVRRLRPVLVYKGV
jgi:tRNA-splicing ligase RtcB (3'-phosphate/5'-hydroxy nucleic acid ligase)